MELHDEPRVDRHGLLQPETLSSTPAGDANGPNYALWLFYLYARPRVFFEHFVADHLPALTALTAWIYGMAGISDRLDRTLGKGTLPALADSWLVYWSILAGGGVLAAALYYRIGGWWYRVRLGWSGVADAEISLVRRVYIYSALVFAFPELLHVVWQTLNYARPIDASNSATFSVFDLAFFLFAIWSIVTSYVGVRTVFKVRGFRGALWFLILPMAIVLLAIGAIVAMAMRVGGFGPAQPPAVTQPIEYRSGDIVFSHPGNWGVDTTHPSFEAGTRVPISMEADAALNLAVYDSEATLDEDVDATIASLKAEGVISQGEAVTSFQKWGRFEGQGRKAHMTAEGETIVYRVFVTEWGEGRRMEVYEVFYASDEATLDRGYRQVADSLRREEVVRP